MNPLSTNSTLDTPTMEWLNEYAPQGILRTDSNLIVCGWNRWLEQNTGRSADAVLGHPLYKVLPELEERRLDKFYQNALQGQPTILAQRFHKYLIRIPASPQYQLPEMQQRAYLAPLFRNGVVIGTITFIEDVSERVVSENELIAATQSAENANKAKDQFLAVLAHDLRTPLTAILGWARLLGSNPEQQNTIHKAAEVIERNAAVQIQLIEQLLDLSRIAAAKLELNREVVNVSEITRNTITGLEPLAAAKNIGVTLQLPVEHRTTALDAKRLQQVIWNLFSNALKFTPAGGAIRATLEYRSDGFQLTIADNGKGISRENIAHLFEPMWQGEGSGRQGGLGLGLAIAKNVVDLHGGSIRAESRGAGQGAAFIVEIPWSSLEPTG